MSTLLFERSLPRFAAARVVSSFGSGRGAGVGPLRLVEQDAPETPADGWVHVDPVLSGSFDRGDYRLVFFDTVRVRIESGNSDT